ncbi:MAG: methyltransferase domain-containing protein [Deltaproteobacteria bacterium]|jgi:glycine/sarcosine N-methyltransferase
MTADPYTDFAERYDLMKLKNSDRDEFFRTLFEKHNVKTILDCACGTGHELILFHSSGYDVQGSDLSESMLKQARKNLSAANLQIPLKRIDFRYLDKHFISQFDAVVCLTSAITEPLADTDALKGLSSMRAALKDGGILVFDQGQTDAKMKNPSKFDLILNESDYSRLFVMDYMGKQMEVHVFDFIHTENEKDFYHNLFRMRIRLQDEWQRMLNQVGFKKIEYFGDWKFAPYDKDTSMRLIAVAKK